MDKAGNIDSVDLLAFALPRILIGVPKSRIVREYSAARGVRVTRQALDYHLDKQNRPGVDTAEACDQTCDETTQADNGQPYDTPSCAPTPKEHAS